MLQFFKPLLQGIKQPGTISYEHPLDLLHGDSRLTCMVYVVNKCSRETCNVPQVKRDKTLEIGPCELMYQIRMMAKDTMVMGALLHTTNQNHVGIYTV